jgi:hypothetical protein
MQISSQDLNGGNITFASICLTEYEGGILTANDYTSFVHTVSKVENIESNIGNIETALDAIIAIQESLINGGENV